MNLSHLLERYLTLLCSQMEKDADFLSRTWVIITIVPFVWYFIAALFKWYILLAPITVPISFWPTVKHFTSQESVSWLKGKASKN